MASRFRRHFDEVLAEERQDATAGIAGRRLVVLGRRQNRDYCVETGKVVGIVVVEEAVARGGIHLDVVVNARRSQRGLENTGHLAHPRPAVPGTVAGDDRAGARQRALGIGGEPTISASPPPMQKPMTPV